MDTFQVIVLLFFISVLNVHAYVRYSYGDRWDGVEDRIIALQWKVHYMVKLEDELKVLEDKLTQMEESRAQIEAEFGESMESLMERVNQMEEVQNRKAAEAKNCDFDAFEEMKANITIMNDAFSDIATLTYQIPNDCQQVMLNNNDINGVYEIFIDGDTSRPLQAYCDFEQDKVWTVVQKRFDGSQTFIQSFSNYVDGFGSLEGEFWLGLENMHQLTQTGRWGLRIELESYGAETAYAEYNRFSIGSGPGYKLSVSGYSGTAGDSLRFHNNMKFSTPMNDQDSARRKNCARTFQGAWWFNRCYSSNLNSFQYGDKGTRDTAMTWNKWMYKTPLKHVEMKIRHLD